mgnify:FL=1
MRFLHTADWHIGKKLHDFSLAEEQAAAFDQIERLAKDYQVDAVVIAGDLYDRGLASEQSVEQLNGMLKQLNLNDHLPLLAISGNHDSAARLATGSEWFETTDFYLHTTLASAFEPVTIMDTQFFLLPFFNLQEVRNYFDQDVKSVGQAMALIVEKMKHLFEPDKKHVLVAHFFAAGSSHTDSEIQVEVGGLDAVPTSLLRDFDYVALGHLHNPRALNEERMRYSGSPLKFSVSEANIQKGVWIVDTDPFKLTWVPLQPLHDLVVLKGSFKELTTGDLAVKYDQTQDYVAIQLTDTKLIDDLMNRMRIHYPKIIEINRPNQQSNADLKTMQTAKMDPMSLLNEFYGMVHTDQKLDDQQRQWAQDALTEIEEG